MAIKKSGEALQLFIDEKMIVTYDKGMPADMQFNALAFEMANSETDNDKYFISNIKITRDWRTLLKLTCFSIKWLQ